mgnify:CR=1 FL=1
MKLGMSSAQTRFFHVVLLICLSGLSGCYGEKPDELTDCLDHAIDNKVSFIREKAVSYTHLTLPTTSRV